MVLIIRHGLKWLLFCIGLVVHWYVEVHEVWKTALCGLGFDGLLLRFFILLCLYLWSLVRVLVFWKLLVYFLFRIRLSLRNSTFPLTIKWFRFSFIRVPRLCNPFQTTLILTPTMILLYKTIPITIVLLVLKNLFLKSKYLFILFLTIRILFSFIQIVDF